MKIILKNYTKKIKKKEILKNINYEFESGNIYGLYGRNGSGKTMLLRAISGLIYPTEGKILINDQELGKDISFISSLGVLIENTKLLGEYTGLENLKILNEIDNACTIKELEQAMEKVGLDPDDSRKVKEYSLGMNQKLALAQAIMSKPEVLLLDEPTNGLDSNSVELIRKEVLRLKELGSLIIIASHNKEDITLLSNNVIAIQKGGIYDVYKKKS